MANYREETGEGKSWRRAKQVIINNNYEQELKSKLIDFYTVLKWDYPNENDATANEFFSF